MRCLAVCGRDFLHLRGLNASIEEITVEGTKLVCGLVPACAPQFDAGSPEWRDQVLVQVEACSCNYRDRRLMLRMAVWGPSAGYYAIGSEFAGRVLAVGASAEHDLKPGTMVIGDGSMAAPGPGGWRGMPTNHASKELLVLAASKLAAVPGTMSATDGAAFSLGAQTSYAMVRRAGVGAGAKVLVCGGRANTSLFLLAALRNAGCEAYVATSSAGLGHRLAVLGAREVFHVGRGVADFEAGSSLGQLAGDLGGLDCVLDPFADVGLGRAVGLLAMGGRYVTCGLADQASDLAGPAAAPSPWSVRDIMAAAIMRNVTIVGNCLGTTADLRRALSDYAGGSLRPVVDSVHTGPSVGGFLRRTFEDPERFGKVVYRHAGAGEESATLGPS